MKIFILFAIIFFSWRVFSADDYFYEGRYYKIDEYIRFQEDPNYQEHVNARKAEARIQRVGVEDYFEAREKAAKAQEKSRQQHLEVLARQPTDNDVLKMEAAYEKERAAEEKRQSALRQEYLARKEMEESKSKKPSRMIASIFETDEDKPLKRVPRESRKYVPKPKSPIEAARAKK